MARYGWRHGRPRRKFTIRLPDEKDAGGVLDVAEDLDCIKTQIEVTAIGTVKAPVQRYPFFLFPRTKTLHVVRLKKACTADMLHVEANLSKHRACKLSGRLC